MGAPSSSVKECGSHRRSHPPGHEDVASAQSTPDVDCVGKGEKKAWAGLWHNPRIAQQAQKSHPASPLLFPPHAPSKPQQPPCPAVGHRSHKLLPIKPTESLRRSGEAASEELGCSHHLGYRREEGVTTMEVGCKAQGAF